MLSFHLSHPLELGSFSRHFPIFPQFPSWNFFLLASMFSPPIHCRFCENLAIFSLACFVTYSLPYSSRILVLVACCMLRFGLHFCSIWFWSIRLRMKAFLFCFVLFFKSSLCYLCNSQIHSDISYISLAMKLNLGKFWWVFCAKFMIRLPAGIRHITIVINICFKMIKLHSGVSHRLHFGKKLFDLEIGMQAIYHTWVKSGGLGCLMTLGSVKLSL